MKNELITILQDTSLSNLKETMENIDSLSFTDKGQLAIGIHNIKAKLKEMMQFVEQFENNLYMHLSEKYPPEIDTEGKLISTQIIDKETGETFGSIEYKQKVNHPFNENKAQVYIRQVGSDYDRGFFYKTVLRNADEIKTDLKLLGMTKADIEDCFDNVPDKIQIKLKIK